MYDSGRADKSIEFFDRTQHVLNTVIAYGNLGINLLLIGDWVKAEDMFNRARALAEKENYVHVAGLYDSAAKVIWPKS